MSEEGIKDEALLYLKDYPRNLREMIELGV